MSSSSDEMSDTEYKQESNRPISSSSSDSSNVSSNPSEYKIEIDRNWSGYDSDSYVAVLGLKRKREIRRDTLSRLIKSDKPRHKRILNSIATKAATKDDDDAFVRLLAKNYKIQILNDKGQTALHLAFYHKSLCVISEISAYIHCWDTNYPDQEPDRTDYIDCNGLTHLHVACAYASFSSLVTNYLENNNYVNARFCDNEQPDESGYTPLHFAVLNRSRLYDVKLTQELIDHGADVNAVDDHGRTPLHLVSRLVAPHRYEKDNNKVFIDYDVSLHESFNDDMNAEGTSESSSKVKQNHRYGKDNKEMIKVMEVLVENKSDINAQDNDGNTPLFMVFTTFDEDCDTDSMKIKISNASIGEAEQKLKFFLKLNVDLTLRNKNGNTLLHQVIDSLELIRSSYFNEPDFAFDDSRHLEMVKLILTCGKKIDIDAKNNKGETPLQLAVSYLSFDIVQLLLEHSADIGNLKLSSDNDHIFKYENVVLSLKPVQKLIDILELLYANGFMLSLKDNLTILKFLTHSHKNCVCVDLNILKSRMDIFHMMCLDLPEHVDNILREFYSRLSEHSFDYTGSYDSLTYSSGMNILDSLREYFLHLELGLIYVNQEAVNTLKSVLTDFETIPEFNFELDLDVNSSMDIMKEIKSLRSIFLIDNVCLHDLLMKNPEETAKYFIKDNFDEKCISTLTFYKDIVKGHATKSLIRYYVQKFAYVFVKILCETPLNYDCCLNIIHYLNVKDVLNVSLAFSDSSA